MVHASGLGIIDVPSVSRFVKKVGLLYWLLAFSDPKKGRPPIQIQKGLSSPIRSQGLPCINFIIIGLLLYWHTLLTYKG